MSFVRGCCVQNHYDFQQSKLILYSIAPTFIISPTLSRWRRVRDGGTAPRQCRWRALWHLRVHNVGCGAGDGSLAVRPQPPCGTDAKRRQQRKAKQEGNTTAKKQERKTRHRGFCCDIHTRNFYILFFNFLFRFLVIFAEFDWILSYFLFFFKNNISRNGLAGLNIKLIKINIKEI